MISKSRITGIAIIIIGFSLAVLFPYYVIAMDYRTFVKFLKIIFIVIIMIFGAFTTATGVILALGWPKKEEEE